jgi:hypothetical protein
MEYTMAPHSRPRDGRPHESRSEEVQRVPTPRQNQKRLLVRFIRWNVCTFAFTANDDSEVGSLARPTPLPLREVESSPKAPRNENNRPQPATKKRSKLFMKRISHDLAE